MPEFTRRLMIRGGVVGRVALTAGTAIAAPDDVKVLNLEEMFLPAQLTQEKIAAGDGATFTKHEHAGATFWMGICDFLGDGVPHALIAIYAPDKEGVFHRCLLAESWAAGNMMSSVDAKTGMLELRETANSTLKGQIVLACSLNTIGTHHSIEAKRPSNR